MEKKRTFKKTSDIGFDRPRRSKTENKKGSKSNFDKKKDFKAFAHDLANQLVEAGSFATS